MRSDQCQYHEYRDPCAPVNPMSVHGSRRRYREHEVEAADAHASALDTAELGLLEQRHDVSRLHVAVTVEMCEEACGLCVCEVDDKHAALWFEHPPDLTAALLADLAREVVKHQGAQHHIELRVRERQRLGNGGPEGHVDACLGGFRGCPRDHRGGRVDAEDVPASANPPSSGNRQTSGSAPHVEDRFASREMREIDETLAEGATSPMCQQPD